MSKPIDFERLDAILEQADALMSTDYRAAVTLLGDIVVTLLPPSHIDDPFGSSYAAWVLETYEKVALVDAYDPPTHEADHNVRGDLKLSEFFPYCTGDTQFIGRYLVGVGMILAELDLPARSRVIEYGVGWGHVTTALARAGHHVTCVDIEPVFLELAKRQAEANGCEVTTYHGSFGDRPYSDDTSNADAVIFFEAFHHSLDHLDVLRRIRRDVLRPGGCLVLAAEPVYPDLPFPWGIRPDGHALWAVRRHKWMELGFHEDYLLRALLREGFLVTRTNNIALGSFGLLYHATLHDGKVYLGNTLLPASEMASWAPAPVGGEPRRWAQVDSRASLDNDPGWVAVTVSAQNHLPVELEATLDVGGTGPATRHRFQPNEALELHMALPCTGRELRVWSETVVPAQLGLNEDTRRLGIAIESVTYHAI